MGYPDEVTAGGMSTLTGDGTDGVDGVSYLSYRGFDDQRSMTFPGCVVGFELVGEEMVRFEGTLMDLVFGGVDAIAENVDGFAQRAEDARAVILFEHDTTILEIDRIGENAVCGGNEMP